MSYFKTEMINGQIIKLNFEFGKYDTYELREINDRDYLYWVLGNVSLSPEVYSYIENYLSDED